MIPNEKRDKSWAQEQLEDPEMFEAFCRELKREAARRALRSLARWAGKQQSESTSVGWRLGHGSAMQKVASECRRCAKKGKP